jgi:glycosyltransferase involved in cell wall biosynthesis
MAKPSSQGGPNAPLRVLIVAETRSPTTFGWVNAVRSAGVIVIGPDGREWPDHPGAADGDRGLRNSVNRRLLAFSKATPGRLKVAQKLQRSVGPSLARRRGRRLRAVIRAVQPDLVHALRIPYEAVTAAAACPLDVPLAVSVWGNDLTLQTVNPLTGKATRKVLARTDLLFADCQRDLDLARDWDLRPVAATSLQPGGGGIDLAPFAEPVRPGNLPDTIPVEPGDRLAVNVRGLREYVRNQTLLDALARLSPEIDPRVKFVFADIPPAARIREEISRHPMSGRIVATGKLSAAEVTLLMLQAEVSLSITDHDGTPNSLLESMAAGAIPVCGDLPSIREWIEPGKNGFLASPHSPGDVAQAISRALHLSPADRAAMIRANRQVVAARAERRSTGQLAADCYRSVVAQYAERVTQSEIAEKL